MANTITRDYGAASGVTNFVLKEVTSADGNDFTFDVPFYPRKIVLAIESTADAVATQWLGLSAADFGVLLRQVSTAAGAVFHTAAGFSVAENSSGGYTVTVDASEVYISAAVPALIEVWR